MKTIPNSDSSGIDRPRAAIVGVQLQGVSEEAFASSLAELERLGETLGLRIIGRVTQTWRVFRVLRLDVVSDVLAVALEERVQCHDSLAGIANDWLGGWGRTADTGCDRKDQDPEWNPRHILPPAPECTAASPFVGFFGGYRAWRMKQ
jgi:hypothetical protein